VRFCRISARAEAFAAYALSVAEIAPVASLLADRTRARILEELLGGVALPVGALAVRAGVAPSTASEHVAKLEAARLVAVTANGRRREVALAGPHVAEALEAMSRLADPPPPVGLRAVDRRQALRRARSCYDHLAGRLGVALADALVDRGALSARDGAFAVGGSDPLFGTLGIDLDALRARRRPLVRACQDWTERRPHVAGALGAAMLAAMLRADWLRRRPDGRALDLTPAGAEALEREGIALV
jgi:DNA-binding transcriptional ArsR family regulator